MFSCFGKRKKLQQTNSTVIANDLANDYVTTDYTTEYGSNYVDNSVLASFSKYKLDNEQVNKLVELPLFKIIELLVRIDIYYYDYDNYISIPINVDQYYFYNYDNIDSSVDLETRKHINTTTIKQLCYFLNNTCYEHKRKIVTNFLIQTNN